MCEDPADAPRVRDGRAEAHAAATERLVQLDVLRGVAIALVLTRHLPKMPDYHALSAWPVTLAVQVGWMGVDLFFVLSGFLVSGLLFREYRLRGRITIGQFLIRRGLKIWPLYFIFFSLVLMAKVGLDLRATGAVLRDRLWDALPSVFFLQTYVGPNPFDHSWSLAVEEHFYLALPTALSLLIVARRRRDDPFSVVPVLTGLVAVSVLVLRIMILPGLPYEPATHFYLTHFRIDSLMFGVLLAYLYHFKPDTLARLQRHRTAMLSVAGLLLLPPFLLTASHWTIWTIGFTTVYLGFGLVLVASLEMRAPRRPILRKILLPAARALTFLGVYSYAIYLCHPYVFSFPVIRNGVRSLTTVTTSPTLIWLAQAAFYVTVVLVSGYVLSVTIERPILFWRDRRLPRAGRPVIPHRDLEPAVPSLPAPPALPEVRVNP